VSEQMRIPRNAYLVGLCAVLMMPLAAGCSDDLEPTPPPDSPVTGTWLATSIVTPTGDAVVDGMSIVATMNDAGTFSLNIAGDVLGICDTGPDCNITGTWTTTETTVTLEFTGQDTTITYGADAGTMTWGGTFNGEDVFITFNRIV
jgi:hypothetical protein